MLCRLFGTVPAIICVSALFPGHGSFGQSSPAAAPPQASGPVVVGEIPGDVKKDFKESPAPVAPSAKPPARIPPVQDASAAYSTSSKPYVIGALDVIEVQVWNSPNLSGYRDVGSDGAISMPLIGEIRADGLTKEQLTTVIRDKLGSSVFADPPEVTIQVVRVNSKKYYVFGAVNHQGEFPLIGNMTVLDAFANTAGFRDFAKTKSIYILRNGKTIKFNFNDVSKGKHMEQNIQLENGDRIFIKD